VNLSLDLPRSSRHGPSLIGRLLFALVLLAAGAAGGFQAGRYWERREPSHAAPVAVEPQQPAPPQPQAAPSQAQQPAVAQAPAPAGAAQAPAQPSATAPQQQAAPQHPANQGQAPAAGTSVTTPPVANAPPAAASPIRRLAATLRGSLEESLTAAVAAEDKQYAEQLTQVVNRLLVWHLQVSRMGLKGDRIEVLWEPPPAPTGLAAGLAPVREPIVHAVKYGSQKLGRELAAYRFQPEGAKWARYYQPDGTELEERLIDSPIAEYEQVTSLLRDGRKHKGVDFKTPVGTPVVAPFDGTIVKRNWNWRFNGNSLEVVDAKSGRHAIFLHLDVLPKEMAPGRRVKKGEVLAQSGNTGHSFAPHLHYQLEDANGKVLDPYQVHATKRIALEGAQKAAFDAARARMEPQLASAR
jgi:murein DD-endopeptidase MepM/ murein hydrolase activator NlpD